MISSYLQSKGIKAEVMDSSIPYRSAPTRRRATTPHDLFFNAGEYGCYCFFGDEPDWAPAWILFVREVDIGKECMQGVRHELQDLFASRDEALDACREYAIQTVQAGDVGL
jgi:hypothetical protein